MLEVYITVRVLFRRSGGRRTRSRCTSSGRRWRDICLEDTTGLLLRIRGWKWVSRARAWRGKRGPGHTSQCYSPFVFSLM